MYFRSSFMEISKVAYFQKAYDVRNVKSNVCICKNACIGCNFSFNVLILITFFNCGQWYEEVGMVTCAQRSPPLIPIILK